MHWAHTDYSVGDSIYEGFSQAIGGIDVVPIVQPFLNAERRLQPSATRQGHGLLLIPYRNRLVGADLGLIYHPGCLTNQAIKPSSYFC